MFGNMPYYMRREADTIRAHQAEKDRAKKREPRPATGDILSGREEKTMSTLTPAKREANARYDEKTYKKYLFTLRIEEDADIIEAIQEAQSRGLKNREWLREIFENQKNF